MYRELYRGCAGGRGGWVACNVARPRHRIQMTLARAAVTCERPCECMRGRAGPAGHGSLG